MSVPRQRDWATLDDLQQRLMTADLIPSQEPLRERIAERFALLGRAGVTSIADLRTRLKDRRAVESLAGESGVDADYLLLLRRAVKGFEPAPRRLREFTWLDADVLASLDAAGVSNSRQLARATEQGPAGLAEPTGLPAGDVVTLAAVADLVRVQWVSPAFARALVAAGVANARALAAADPDVLVTEVAVANEAGGFYRGTIGRRDIGRVIDAARYVPWGDQSCADP